jgi:hypothetical protein
VRACALLQLRADPSLKIVNSSMVYTSPEACKPIRTSDDGMEVRLGALARVQGDVKITVSNSWGKVRARAGQDRQRCCISDAPGSPCFRAGFVRDKRLVGGSSYT